MRCRSCSFATVDEAASDSKWRAYECTNPKSPYHKALLNVTAAGDKNERITWSGCDYGEEKE